MSVSNKILTTVKCACTINVTKQRKVGEETARICSLCRYRL